VANFGDYQTGIYAEGMFGGKAPEMPTGLAQLEQQAAEVLSPEALGYITPSAGSGATARANRQAFDRWRIVPRMLRGAATRSLSSVVLGSSLPAPLALAPIGVQTLAHPEGELATARAAAAVGLAYTHSCAASHSPEEAASAADAAGGGPRWFQLYWPTDPDVCASFLTRAQAAGYTALIVTLDTTTLGWRPADLDRGFLPFLRGEGIATYLSDPAFRAGLAQSPEDDPAGAIMHWAGMFPNPALSWDDLPFVRSRWDGPIALKGILSPDDARRARDAGMDGVVVSNHGGRQVDGAIASLDALPSVVDAVGDRLDVLFDSGVRTGADVVKALALGARAVLVGRPYLYGLALGGQAGVEHVLRCLLAEVDLTMHHSGHPALSDLGPSTLVRADPV
jgi:isopentenyl diphosphate isomerase/L-lactate dehydrogenase-like FMN-dependent dehydrogenase